LKNIEIPNIEKIDNKKFGLLYAPKNILEFGTWINYFTLKAETISGWRGQANVNWDIESGAIRRIKKTYLKENSFFSEEYGYSNKISVHLIEYEEKLLNNFRHEGYDYNNSIKMSDLECLAKLQHHGAATRLIDFTYNIFVALWFCCSNENEIENNGVIIGCQRQNNYLDLSFEESKSLKINEIAKKYSDKIVFWKPTYNIQRMLIQQSVFAFGDIFEKTDEEFKSNDYKSKFQENFVAVIIPPSLKKDVRKYGETFLGLNSLIYPDFEGFCQLNNQSRLLPDLKDHNNGTEMNKYNNINE
jgi:hypothetical protein